MWALGSIMEYRVDFLISIGESRYGAQLQIYLGGWYSTPRGKKRLKEPVNGVDVTSRTQEFDL